MKLQGKLSIVSYFLSFFFIYLAARMQPGSERETVLHVIAAVLLLLGAFLALVQNRLAPVGICDGGEKLTAKELAALRKTMEDQRKELREAKRDQTSL